MAHKKKAHMSKDKGEKKPHKSENIESKSEMMGKKTPCSKKK